MKGGVLFVVGIAVGFVAAHQVAKTPEGKQFFSDVDTKAREFTSAVVDGYRERRSRFGLHKTFLARPSGPLGRSV